MRAEIANKAIRRNFRLLSFLHLPPTVLGLPSTILRPLSLVIPVLYLLANLAASLWTALLRGWSSLPFLPIIFTILHLSYGLGFLLGLVKFWNRWADYAGETPE